MSTPTSLRFRDARDRIIDLLGLGETYPLRDVPVPDERLTVPFGSPAHVTVSFGQQDVAYGLRDKDGHAIGNPVTGAGDVLTIQTPAIHDDVTYTVHARKPTGREADLLATATVKVGLDLSLNAFILPANAPQPIIVDYGNTITVWLPASQDGVDYRLVQFPNGDPAHPDDMATAQNDVILSAGNQTVRGTGGAIDLPSKPMTEDAVLRIRAIKIFDASLTRPPQTNILAIKLPLLVRADPARAVTPTPGPVTAYGAAAGVLVAQAQASAAYQVFVHTVTDPEYSQGAGPGPGIAAVKVDGAPDALVQIPALPPLGAALPGFTAVGGGFTQGAGANLPLGAGALTDDTVVAILARKRHTVTGTPVTSMVWLAQTPVVLVRPDPNAKPLPRVWLQAGQSDRTMDLTGGQPGVFYTPTVNPGGIVIQPPAYVHKHDAADATVNKGLGQLKLEVDYVIARDQATPSPADLPHTPPPPPRLATPVITAGATLSFRATKAQTRVTADLAATATIDPLPDVKADALIDYGGAATVTVGASRQSDGYTLLHNGQPVGAAQDGTGSTLTFTSDKLTQDTVLEISAVSKAPLPVERRGQLPVALRPNPGLTVRVQDATVVTGTPTVILVDASQAGIAYQLKAGANTVGAAVNGTGGTISLPTAAVAAATTFSVTATRLDNANASVTLAQTAAVAVKPA